MVKHFINAHSPIFFVYSPVTFTNNMRKLFLLSALLFNLLTITFAQIRVPAASPAATVSQAVGLAKVTVDYSRPALKGRVMFGDQVPYGKVWRTGADRSTKVTVSEPIIVNGTSLPAGSYGLFTIPGQTEWTVIFSKDAMGSGAFNYKAENDVMRFSVKPEKITPTEYFTIEFADFTPTSANLTLRWENVQIKVPLKQEPDAQIIAQLNEELAKSEVKPGTYYLAANYYFDTKRDLKQARIWADKLLETSKEYWTYYLRAKIAARQGDCKTAIADATSGLELARKGNDDAYVKNHQRVLADCKQ